MQPFHALTKPAQFRRLSVLARTALRDYTLGEVSLSPLQNIQNATWSVKCRNGLRYVLRVHSSERHDAATIRSELLWLEALSATGEFVVPTPFRTTGGKLWTVASASGVPGQRICTLLNWVPGRVVLKTRTPEMLARMGSLMARLHEHAVQFRVPKSFVRPIWDHRGLFDHDGPRQVGWKRLSTKQKSLFKTAAQKSAKVMQRLGTERDLFGLIHGDLIFDNVVFYRGEPRPIDFDDCGFGYFLYDIAILLDRIEMRDNYAALRAALLEGYRQIRPLAAEHEAHLDLFLLARWVYLGVCFLSRPEFSGYAPRFMKVVEPKMARYLQAMS